MRSTKEAHQPYILLKQLYTSHEDQVQAYFGGIGDDGADKQTHIICNYRS